MGTKPRSSVRRSAVVRSTGSCAPGSAGAAAQLSVLLLNIDRAYDHKSWHGTGLRGALRRVDAQQAVWRPGRTRHNIAEQVQHAAYWKYAVRRRLLNEPRAAFALAGSNWFGVDGPLSEADWKRQVALLDEQHGLLRAAVAALDPVELSCVRGGRNITHEMLIMGIAAHDLYHTGQIQLLKALQKGRDEAD